MVNIALSKIYDHNRQHHGFLCLCSLSFRFLMIGIQISEFSIVVSVLDRVILEVYILSNMMISQFLSLLKDWRPLDLIVEDINVRFDKTFDNRISDPADRLIVVS